MAVYKVIQDVEAEDKLLGPLTLKGFIYAGIAGTCAFIEFKLLFIGTALKYPFILLFAAPMLLFGVLASPLGREQPTEVWLLSRIKFFFKPRKRIWDQSGLQELVTITAPKKEERQLTKNLSQSEVQSRLKTLALTLDTRGWAIKNVDVNLSVPEVEAKAATVESDRLVGSVGLPQQMAVADVRASDDIMDEKHNLTAQKFDALMKRAETDRKQGILLSLKGLVDDHETKDKERHKKSSQSKTTKDLPSTKAAQAAMQKEQEAAIVRRKAEEEAEVEEKLAKARMKFGADFEHGQKRPNPRHKIASVKKSPARVEEKVQPTRVTAADQAVNMELAQSGSAFSVATLSGLANRQPQIEQTGPNEVTISLH